MIEPITVTYRVTPEDYRRAVRLWYGTRRIIFVDIVVAVALVAIALSEPLGPAEALRSPFVWLGIGFIFLLPVTLFVVPTWRANRDPRFAAEYEVTFSDEGVVTKSAVGVSQLNWPFFIKARFDDRTCVLFYSSRQFMTVPLRVFTSHADRALFLDLVRSKVAKVEAY